MNENQERYKKCSDCKNFWWAFPLRPQVLNGCTRLQETPKEKCKFYEKVEQNNEKSD